LKLYETTVVIDSTLKADEVRHQQEKISNFISNHGGKIVKVEDWGKRRLAYEINKKQYGFYAHIRFEAPAAVPVLLEREYRLNEAVVRNLTIKVDPKALQSEEKKAKAEAAAKNGEVWDEVPVVVGEVAVV